jgi:hypothetical protein
MSMHMLSCMFVVLSVHVLYRQLRGDYTCLFVRESIKTLKQECIVYIEKYVGNIVLGPIYRLPAETEQTKAVIGYRYYYRLLPENDS